MFSQSSSDSSKAVCRALPLLTHEAVEQSTTKTSAANTTMDADKSYPSSSVLHLLAGYGMGVTCYYAVSSMVVPFLPHMTNVIVDYAVLALIRSTFAALVTCSLWFGYVMLYKAYRSKNSEGSNSVADDDTEAANTETMSYWSEMQHYYTLGLFVGLSTACVVALARRGAPFCIWLVFLSMAFAWTQVLCSIRIWPLNKESAKTVLPAIVVQTKAADYQSSIVILQRAKISNQFC